MFVRFNIPDQWIKNCGNFNKKTQLISLIYNVRVMLIQRGVSDIYMSSVLFHNAITRWAKKAIS